MLKPQQALEPQQTLSRVSFPPETAGQFRVEEGVVVVRCVEKSRA